MLHQSFSTAHDMIHIKEEHLIQANTDMTFHLKNKLQTFKKSYPY
jgi:hypothetical protein